MTWILRANKLCESFREFRHSPNCTIFKICSDNFKACLKAFLFFSTWNTLTSKIKKSGMKYWTQLRFMKKVGKEHLLRHQFMWDTMWDNVKNAFLCWFLCYAVLSSSFVVGLYVSVCDVLCSTSCFLLCLIGVFLQLISRVG